MTSGSPTPWNTSKAIVVVARMVDLPYTPTPQQARSTGQQGNGNDPEALAGFILALLCLAASFIGAVALYRRTSLRSAYLLLDGAPVGLHRPRRGSGEPSVAGMGMIPALGPAPLRQCPTCPPERPPTGGRPDLRSDY